ncbi:major facilitator superfamily domain-containing protein [Tricharina praecox]|uniref:major facilitator superfamily domain-containing protein n=1 Tax=Tricharina praecox TaxID=43433 RepID=UPI00221F9182|nr:major facilitator superfamily domain-containing protein [Tricharina praecox]KAI5851001.1 major facilitator superfamily domain-containing protein [Tricharina praecox]
MGALRKAKVALWGEIPATKAEKKLLLKIDWFILSFCCLAYFCNYLDRSNINNAYVSGMKEDLNMSGNQITKISAIFTCGYIAGMIPNNIALLKFPPRIWFPFTILAWGLLTLGTFNVSSVEQIYVIRFFQGFFEASSFVGTHYILGSWYTESELAKRSGIFTASGLAGTLFSGILQSSIHKSMDGLRGIAGWRWLFIIDFLITLPVAVYGFICFPDTPETTKAFYLTAAEKKLAVERLPKKAETSLTWDIFKRVLGRWHFWMFSVLWAISGEVESFSTNNLFGLYLADMGRSVAVRNNYPMGVSAVGIVTTLIAALYVDLTKKHWHIGVWSAFIGILSSSLVLAYRPEPLVFVGYYIAGGIYAVQAAFFAWANVICHNDNEERAIVLASMNLLSNAVNAWWAIVFYSANFAPRFERGMWAMIGTSIALVAWTVAIRWFQRRDAGREMDKQRACEVAEE